ncbi:MAG: hypothetical protein QOG18_832 [Microbacteriaceae bacterium]|nr:hypothetical protein [Microbacteriaceae bacterium]MDQ1526219.1 hypothetical protein [Microbacteriaceae bacterium]
MQDGGRFSSQQLPESRGRASLLWAAVLHLGSDRRGSERRDGPAGRLGKPDEVVARATRGYRLTACAWPREGRPGRPRSSTTAGECSPRESTRARETRGPAADVRSNGLPSTTAHPSRSTPSPGRPHAPPSTLGSRRHPRRSSLCLAGWTRRRRVRATRSRLAALASELRPVWLWWIGRANRFW